MTSLDCCMTYVNNKFLIKIESPPVSSTSSYISSTPVLAEAEAKKKCKRITVKTISRICGFYTHVICLRFRLMAAQMRRWVPTLHFTAAAVALTSSGWKNGAYMCVCCCRSCGMGKWKYVYHSYSLGAGCVDTGYWTVDSKRNKVRLVPTIGAYIWNTANWLEL